MSAGGGQQRLCGSSSSFRVFVVGAGLLVRKIGQGSVVQFSFCVFKTYKRSEKKKKKDEGQKKPPSGVWQDVSIENREQHELQSFREQMVHHSLPHQLIERLFIFAIEKQRTFCLGEN